MLLICLHCKARESKLVKLENNCPKKLPLTSSIFGLPNYQFVRPVWAIFESSWLHIFTQKQLEYFVTFSTVMKNITLLVKSTIATFWAILRKFGQLLSDKTWSHCQLQYIFSSPYLRHLMNEDECMFYLSQKLIDQPSTDVIPPGFV